MPRLGRMIDRLARNRSQWEAMMNVPGAVGTSLKPPPAASGHLAEIGGFGSNPGNLRMFAHVPRNMPSSPALVVVLHGCTQTAAAYDHGAGWSTLADRYGFVVVLPEQQEINNPKRCFNWFQPGDIQRDRGEVFSIRQMVERAALDYGVDRDRIFITGLSAGGAMASAMLAAYPEVFAGGAIIAGLPYRCATSVSEAFECMFQGQARPAREWGDLVREASPHPGPWPRVSVWHGSADSTVKHMNAGEIIKQWTDVHGLPPSPTRDEIVDGYPRRVWTDAAGREIIEEYIITGMEHGTPLAIGNGENSYGAAGPFLLDAGISSSYHIAKFWGLTENVHEAARDEEPPGLTRNGGAAAAWEEPAQTEETKDRAAAWSGLGPEDRKALSSDIGSMLAKALKAFGLAKRTP